MNLSEQDAARHWEERLHRWPKRPGFSEAEPKFDVAGAFHSPLRNNAQAWHDSAAYSMTRAIRPARRRYSNADRTWK